MSKNVFVKKVSQKGGKNIGCYHSAAKPEKIIAKVRCIIFNNY